MLKIQKKYDIQVQYNNIKKEIIRVENFIDMILTDTSLSKLYMKNIIYLCMLKRRKKLFERKLLNISS